MNFLTWSQDPNYTKMSTAKNIDLQNFPLFSVLTKEEQERAVSMMELKRKRRHDFIYFPDDASDSLYFLTKGTVKIGTHSIEDGKEVIKSLVHPGRMFGELSLVGEEKRVDFARALKDEVEYYVMKLEDFNTLKKSNIALYDKVVQLFGTRLMNAENKLESLIFKDARTRIIDFIKQSIEDHGRRIGVEWLFRHSLTHQDMANITCTSRQTVTLVLNDLKRHDLIHFNRGKILVRDMNKLQ